MMMIKSINVTTYVPNDCYFIPVEEHPGLFLAVKKESWPAIFKVCMELTYLTKENLTITLFSLNDFEDEICVHLTDLKKFLSVCRLAKVSGYSLSIIFDPDIKIEKNPETPDMGLTELITGL